MTPHLNRIDRKSMNGITRAIRNGTQSQRVLRQTSQVVVPADVVVDLHAGTSTRTRPYSYWFRVDGRGWTRRKLASFGLDHIIVTDVISGA
jgi:predicted deacylase